MGPASQPPDGSRNNLRRDLRGWQIFFIVASVIIGEGVFSGDSQALEVAGPYGIILGLVLMGILSVCVMEGLSELVQLFAVPNAIFEYIRVFVDEDLAWACGIAYWYTWASVFAALNLTAANFSDYWDLQPLWKNIIFFFLAPCVLFGINMVGVWLFGWIETIGGFLKITLVFGTGIVMYHLYVTRPSPDQDMPIYDGFEADAGIVPDQFSAVCYVIPILAYSFLGSETVAVTAFEAEDIRSLRRPSQTIAYVIMGLYFFTLVSELLLTSWLSPILPAIYGNTNTSQTPPPAFRGDHNLPVVALQHVGNPSLASFLNACYIYSVLSASNSALYVASRTLYGLTRGIKSDKGVPGFFARFNKTVPRSGVPGWAVLGSVLAFIWFPFVSNVNNSLSVTLLFDVMEVTASVMCLIVWAALSLSFIRFKRWVRLCKGKIDDRYARYDRETLETYDAHSAFSFAQPLPAYIGLIGSLLVVFVLTTATWWNGNFTGAKFALAYAGPLVVVVLWLGRKLALYKERTGPRATNDNRWHGWVIVSDDADALMRVFADFEFFKPPEDQPRWRDKIRENHPWLTRYFGGGRPDDSGEEREVEQGSEEANGAVMTQVRSVLPKQEHPSGLALRNVSSVVSSPREIYEVPRFANARPSQSTMAHDEDGASWDPLTLRDDRQTR